MCVCLFFVDFPLHITLAISTNNIFVLIDRSDLFSFVWQQALETMDPTTQKTERKAKKKKEEFLSRGREMKKKRKVHLDCFDVRWPNIVNTLAQTQTFYTRPFRLHM